MIDKVSSCLRNISIKPFQNNEIEKQSSDVLKNNTKMQNTSDAMTGVPLMKYRNISPVHLFSPITWLYIVPNFLLALLKK